MINDFALNVATVNGSGSQSANQLIVRSLFRMGVPVSGKNLFPSNIAGLPTWFTVRVSKDGYITRRALHDIVVALNPETAEQDLASLKAGGFYLYNQEFKLDPSSLRANVTAVPIPFREITQKASDSVKMRKLLANMVYVGVLGELLGIDFEILRATIADQFAGKAAVIDVNVRTVELGREFAREHLAGLNFPYKVQKVPGGNAGKILIDGNSAAALGLLYGGCTVMAWYPITPSSSLAESFENYARACRVDEEGRNRFAVVQAEDELAAINMVIGAGWAGARAVTATSGPGLSLMSEAAGLAYFAEIPAVIWDVQRAGPSTGLPTRTMQGDLRSASSLSHGDTEHVVLLPATPEECFEFGQTCFDLAERLQTLVIVLSDLDLGMNLWIADEFKPLAKPFDRGKVLSAEQLNERNEFARYQDVDGDGIPYRTLPGTLHAKAAYFTRGTGHNEQSAYSEDNATYRRLLERLRRKFVTARQLVPAPVVETVTGARVGVIAYGSTHHVIAELRAELRGQLDFSYLRLRALPLRNEVRAFIESHERVVVVEQNRDGQLREILAAEWPELAGRLVSVTQFDGLPLECAHVAREMARLTGVAAPEVTA